MSRTWHATGTGSFTRAGEVRADRSALRDYNKNPANRLNQKSIPIHGATSGTGTEGKITYEQAQQLIKNGDKIRTPDGILHTVRADNRNELIGRLGAVITLPAKNEGRAPVGGNVIPRGTTVRWVGNAADKVINKDGTVQGKSGGQKGKAQRIDDANKPLQRKVNQALPLETLKGIGQGTNAINKGQGIGFQKVGPTSTYKPSPNSKKTQTTSSKGNAKLNTRIAKVGGFAPRSTRGQMTKAYAARRAANAKQRAADKKAGVQKPVQKRGPRAALPKGTIRSGGQLKGVQGARINRPNSTRKGGRSGRGRSK